MPAGIFEQTPFPITETGTEYSIKNDESPAGKTFYLGTKYFVDGGYNGGQSDGSWEKPWKSISAALAKSGSGNTTIIIRGAHDDFNGIYYGTYSLASKAGIDDTHRFMLAGYGQERPILDGMSGTEGVLRRGSTIPRDAYISVQRLKVQNTQASCVRLGWDATGDKRDNYFSVIDIHFYECGNRANEMGTDGSAYYLNSDYGWIFHSTSEHTFGHGFKIGDGSSHNITEWSVAKDIGWWQGIPLAFKQSPVAFDFPVDTDSRNQHDNIVRYNIANSVLNYALQIRRVKGFSVHHNEFYDAIHHDEIPPQRGTIGKYIAIIFAGQADGNFYSNILRDPGNPMASLLFIQAENVNSPKINIYNNLFYGATGHSIVVGYNNSTPVRILNNTIYSDNSSSALYNRAGTYGYQVYNNIIYQAGAGKIFETYLGTTSPEHSNNVLFAPQGSIGLDLNATETGADPRISIPSGAYSALFGEPDANSPAIDNGTGIGISFSNDFRGTERPQGAGWDIGAFEYTSGSGTQDPPQQPVDTDFDAVPNAGDKCPKTAIAARPFVNIFGCAMPIATHFDIKPDFNATDINGLQSLELGISSLGKIVYSNKSIILVKISSGEDERLNIDEGLLISQNKITLNQNSLPQLNFPAAITFYNTDFRSPKILKDGTECTACSIVSYERSAKTITFTVPGL